MSLRKYLMPSDISPSEAFKATEVPNTPLAQPEQRTGKWIKGHCSECGDHAPYWSMSSAYYGSKFCPNCGAKMEGDAE